MIRQNIFRFLLIFSCVLSSINANELLRVLKNEAGIVIIIPKDSHAFTASELMQSFSTRSNLTSSSFITDLPVFETRDIPDYRMEESKAANVITKTSTIILPTTITTIVQNSFSSTLSSSGPTISSMTQLETGSVLTLNYGGNTIDSESITKILNETIIHTCLPGQECFSTIRSLQNQSSNETTSRRFSKSATSTKTKSVGAYWF